MGWDWRFRVQIFSIRETTLKLNGQSPSTSWWLYQSIGAMPISMLLKKKRFYFSFNGAEVKWRYKDLLGVAWLEVLSRTVECNSDAMENMMMKDK